MHAHQGSASWILLRWIATGADAFDQWFHVLWRAGQLLKQASPLGGEHIVQGVSGFLKKSDIAADAKPKAGALLDVVIQLAADKRLVTVTAVQEAVAAAVLKDDAATELGGSCRHSRKHVVQGFHIPFASCQPSTGPLSGECCRRDCQCRAAG